MKLSEYSGEQALDILADIIEPMVEICSDKEIMRQYRSGQKIRAVQRAIKEHKKSVITILAVMDGADPAEYNPKLVTLPMRLLEILNDPDLVSLFQSQGQSSKASSGSAMVNTEAKEN